MENGRGSRARDIRDYGKEGGSVHGARKGVRGFGFR